jgi:hypothetical protein
MTYWWLVNRPHDGLTLKQSALVVLAMQSIANVADIEGVEPPLTQEEANKEIADAVRSNLCWLARQPEFKG